MRGVIGVVIYPEILQSGVSSSEVAELYCSSSSYYNVARSGVSIRVTVARSGVSMKTTPARALAPAALLPEAAEDPYQPEAVV